MRLRYKILARLQKYWGWFTRPFRWIYQNHEERLYRKRSDHEFHVTAPGVKFKLVPYDEVSEEALQELDGYLRVQAMKALIREGQVGYVALRGGKPVHRSFVLRGPARINLAGEAFDIEEEEALIHYCKTDPNHRGQGIYPSVLSRLLKKVDAVTVYISCDSSNQASIRGIKKAGFETVGRRRHRVVFGRHTLVEA